MVVVVVFGVIAYLPRFCRAKASDRDVYHQKITSLEIT